MTGALLRCEGCGYEVADLRREPWAFRCPGAAAGADDVDHLLAPVPVRGAPWPEDGSPNPFVRFRERLFIHRAALSLGLGDERYLQVVLDLDAAVSAVDGRGLRETPCLRSPALESALAAASGAAPGAIGAPAEVWVKDETGNVAGSHKARHLFGIAVYLKLLQAAGVAPGSPLRLAIASCGNAALAAAVVARAAALPLEVFVPGDAHPRVLSRLRDLHATIHVCERSLGELGDPCVHAFRAAVAAGAVPFACQGTDNGITLDGGLTLGFEIADAFRRGPCPHRVFVQIGGGALGSSLYRALDQSVQTGVLPRAPRLMTVQTERVAPLAEAHRRVASAILARCPDVARPADEGDTLADALRSPAASQARAAVLADLAAHRSRYLRSWPSPAPSLAHGILDDDTYDGAALSRGMLETGGSPILVSESALAEAEELCRRATGIDADATGTASLAGLLQWTRAQRSRAHPSAAREALPERVVVLVTGHRR